MSKIQWRGSYTCDKVLHLSLHLTVGQSAPPLRVATPPSQISTFRRMGIVEEVHNVRVVGSGSTNPDYFDFERYSSLEGYTLDLLEELRIQSCIFVGHSLSGVVGMLASIARPDHFTKLVMLSASPRH
ncbi:hypothetical protein AMTR_s00001p00272320 [Amborella trichopoda]|uniref:AB hydrolase-1 domain-containing protein n=1 Tax=Amborella trichopoda TaxID=13333 RepID=W1NMV7_AMBTC|nr:hypothetical protein AMTR_s00001p00272320 [Amborella trichopoda]